MQGQATSSFFDGLNGFDAYGVPRTAQGAALPTSLGPGLERSAGPSASDDTPPWHPDSPLFWVGAFILATFGLAGVSVRVRAGAANAAANVGKT